MKDSGSALLLTAVASVAVGVVMFFAVTLVSVWSYNGPGDRVAPAIAASLAAALIVLVGSSFPIVGLIGGVTMLLLFVVGMMTGEPTALVAELGLDLPALLAHAGRSGIVAAAVGTLITVGSLSTLAARARGQVGSEISSSPAANRR